ncbi:Uu.00g124830.m01.CDS01 [Anthostomella pinea]|uniref:Uu.00g124830.m01.CDS01 n=1 Tax=Anthostomella pinea TaxID=933095 RepID=A0AAI8VHJ8_9PEZI|nr:Uu.00g124830.m01.CDS01 [Anthostomella pinea]
MSPPAQSEDFAFSFDIDGVIYKSGQLCQGAKEAMTWLSDNNVPFIFLTNGGGKTEDVRAADMAERLGIPLSPSQFIQAHTPFKNQVPSLADKKALVLGGVGDECRFVAEHYGFKVITSADIVTAYPSIFPFNEMYGSYFAKTARPLAVRDGENSPSLEIAAIFIFSSPRDWGLDLQIITNLLLSERGRFGTLSPLNGNPDLPNKGYLQDGQPRIFFANPDHTYATKHPFPRVCQGSFKLALQGIWSGLTGTQLINSTHYSQLASRPNSNLNMVSKLFLKFPEKSSGRSTW